MERRKRNIDMLSGLPDEVICHILSFLPTKLSVSTSVLAKRWRFLWAHVPSLEFYRRDFKGKKTKPLDIINRVVMLHEAKIVDTFRLSYLKGCAYQLDSLVIYPIKRSVRNLYLDFGFEYEDDIVCTLPRLLFTCKTLVDLQLVCCGLIPSSGEVSLPSLKKLHLKYVEYEDDESLPHLLSGCPVLEELIVVDCLRKEQKNSGCVVVSSPTIKTLNVSFCLGGDDCPDEMLIIDVPALVYLKVIHCNLEYVKSLRKPMASLIEAEITLYGEWHYCDIDCTEHARSIEFLRCLCNVKYLKISSGYAEQLVDIARTGSIGKFDHLTKLELDLTVDWYDLVKFLEVADNLEVLIINACLTPPYKEPKRVPTCMLSRLQTVKMYFFSVCEDAFDTVRYILENAQVLQRMEIYPLYNASDKQKLDTLKRISLFERGSKSCQLAFDTALWNAE